jgi:hypothetical protein
MGYSMVDCLAVVVSQIEAQGNIAERTLYSQLMLCKEESSDRVAKNSQMA